MQSWARLDLHWESEAARHCDSLFVPRDHLSHAAAHPLIRDAARDLSDGQETCLALAPGELVSAWHADRCRSITPCQFEGTRLGPLFSTPRLGRFYPAMTLASSVASSVGALQPVRCIHQEPERIGFDLNHPLAERPSRLEIRLEEIPVANGWCQDASGDPLGMLVETGPGMQARWRGLPTDVWSDDPFARQDSRPDASFYRAARFVDHLDSNAIARMRSFYRQCIPPSARILDLMASWHSHLPEDIAPACVIGLGLNAEELAANPVLDQALVQDLNVDPRLPFADASFEAVICSLSVEYLVEPQAVFREIARLLCPGGVLAVTFSNRWFPPKVVRLWPALHEFERPGLVLEYFLESGLYRDLASCSLRGLPRPGNDRHADRLHLSDPLHGVWGYRA